LFFYLFVFLSFIMFDSQVLSTSSFKAHKTGVTYYNADIFIPSISFVLPLISTKSFAVGAKGKVVLGYTIDRRSLRVVDFIPAA